MVAWVGWCAREDCRSRLATCCLLIGDRCSISVEITKAKQPNNKQSNHDTVKRADFQTITQLASKTTSNHSMMLQPPGTNQATSPTHNTHPEVNTTKLLHGRAMHDYSDYVVARQVGSRFVDR